MMAYEYYNKNAKVAQAKYDRMSASIHNLNGWLWSHIDWSKGTAKQVRTYNKVSRFTMGLEEDHYGIGKPQYGFGNLPIKSGL